MEIPATGSSGTPAKPNTTARAKPGEATAAPAQPESPTAGSLNQANAASNPAAGAGLTQAQADTAKVILKGPTNSA